MFFRFCFTIFAFCSLNNPLFSQSKINFPLLKVISDPEKQNDKIHLAVKGDIEKIKSAVIENGGIFKYSFRDISPSSPLHNYSFITLPAKKIKGFSENDFVVRIEYTGGRPVMLNDTMKINMNVNGVHQGLQPLLQAYDGSGVLVGIIDAGIELKHPDFLDSLGRTRVISLWDQTMPVDQFRTPSYGYGQVWDSTDINQQNPNLPMEQSTDFFGHGSHVSGIAAGDGSSDSVPVFKGMAPKANLIVVSSDFGANDWLQTVADGVDFIFNMADSLNKPCVINISAGTYSGSHDGKDLPALVIDNLVSVKSGRAVVCAAGNAGATAMFHLRTSLVSDSKFTWFKKNSSFVVSGYAPNGGVYFELFSDTADFNNVSFSFGADKNSPNFEWRGMSGSYNIKNLFNGTYNLDGNGIFSDTLKNSSGQRLAKIYFAADLINNGSTYAFYVLLNPDSSQYYYRFSTSGTGVFDVWSNSNPGMFGASDMVYDSLPLFSEFPDIINYSMPDYNQTMVSSFSCAPNVITVGNYTNRHSYLSYFGNEILTGVTPGTIFPNSSKGPTRDGRIKPDISAPGAPVLSAGDFITLAIMKNNGIDQLSQGGMHREFSGTSMSSPAIAGLAALYFQKCPAAPVNDFYYSLIQNARVDTSTGSVPNNTWGYGKADAFETLKSSNFQVPVINPDSIACPGPVKLTIDTLYSSYQWNSGGTGISNTVNQTGNYFALVTNPKGCKGKTDTIVVYINDSLPSPAIIVGSNPYFCEGDSVNLLYPDTFINYLWNSGNTDNNFFAEITGFYRVTATASNGCNFISDSVLVWSKPNPPEPLISQNADTLFSTPANGYQWYSGGIVLPGDTNQKLVISQSGYYRVEVFHVNGCSAISDSIFAEKTGENGLSAKEEAFIIFPNPGNGRFLLLNQIQTEPLIEKEIRIYNGIGELILNSAIVVPVEGIEFDLGENARGIYFIKICNEMGAIFTKKIIIE